MSLPERDSKLLALETALPLTQEDFQTMGQPLRQEDRDLAGYLTFLEEIGAFSSKKTKKVEIYSEEFEL
jgi:hypothetical protein